MFPAGKNSLPGPTLFEIFLKIFLKIIYYGHTNIYGFLMVFSKSSIKIIEVLTPRNPRYGYAYRKSQCPLGRKVEKKGVTHPGEF